MLYLPYNDSLQKAPETPCVYWITSYTDSTKTEIRPIVRVSGQDDYGILYIGETQSLRERLKEMQKMLDRGHADLIRDPRKKAGHPFAFEWLVSGANEHAYPINTLAVLFQRVESKARARDLETIYLVNYRDTFGEYPPLNQTPPRPKDYGKFCVGKKGRFYYDENCRTWFAPDLGQE